MGIARHPVGRCISVFEHAGHAWSAEHAGQCSGLFLVPPLGELSAYPIVLEVPCFGTVPAAAIAPLDAVESPCLRVCRLGPHPASIPGLA